VSKLDSRHRAGRTSLQRLRGVVAVVACALPLGAAASPHSVAECFEGSDFVANAARARDTGMSRSAFLERRDEDLVMIRAYPPALRWFAKDREDEQMLRGAAAEVFDAPRSPDAHRARFLEICFADTTI